MACLLSAICGQSQWVLIAVVLTIASYYYFTWKRTLSYWKDRNISGPAPIPIFGNFLANYFKPKPILEVEWYKKYGRIYGVINGKSPGLTVAEPALVKQILVKDFYSFRNRGGGESKHKIFANNMFSAKYENWKRIRAIASPTFTSGKMKKMYSLINECCNDFIQNLDDLTANSQSTEVELKKLMGEYTMDVIARCAFALKINTYKNPDNPFTTRAHNRFNVPLWKTLLLATLPTFIVEIQFIRQIISSTSDSDFFADYSQKLIKHRKHNNEKHNDFLQLLMDVERGDGQTREESDTNEAHHVNEGTDELNADIQAFSNVIEKKLTEDEVLAQCFLFFIAGYETTATTLSYCTYELALHPELQERLREETAHLFNEKGEIDYETLSKLPFLDALISETLRFYPPLLRLQRMAMEDIVLGEGTGVTIEKGVIAEIPVYAMHHDPLFYSEPEVFNPDRFIPENRTNIKPYTYIPFGAGPHNCIGMRFALLEAKVVLAKISQKFKFFRVFATDVPVIYNRGRGLLQAKQLVVGVEKV